MPFMDRDSFIALLDGLGDPDDTTALANARAVHARLKEAGLSWDDLLVPPPGASDLDDDHEDAAPAVVTPTPDPDGDAALIDRLLADYDLSATTRQELIDLKADIAVGEFTLQDSRYVRNLADRLSRHKAVG